MKLASDNESSLPRLLPLGDTAWTVEFGETIDPALHARVLGLAAALKSQHETAEAEKTGGPAGPFAAVRDVVPTFRSLTVHFDPLECDGQRLGEALLALARDSGSAEVQGRQWLIPVCFDDDYAPDLAELAQSKALSRDDVIALITQTQFQVYMIGFMPGFPYMGGLPEVLQMPRLSSPRESVPERSLAVAGEMCAVYPWESPGGWRLLGRTPIPLFQANEAEPALLASGDQVRWRAIDRATYQQLERDVQTGLFDRQSLRFHAQGEGA